MYSLWKIYAYEKYTCSLKKYMSAGSMFKVSENIL